VAAFPDIMKKSFSATLLATRAVLLGTPRSPT
jgi:hypothetical protein